MCFTTPVVPKATIEEVESMGHKLPVVPGVRFTDEEAKKLKSLAKKSVNADKKIADAQKKQKDAEDALIEKAEELKTVTRSRDIWKQRFEDLQKQVAPFMSAIINFPQELLAFISRHWQERKQERQQQKSYSQEAR